MCVCYFFGKMQNSKNEIKYKAKIKSYFLHSGWDKIRKKVQFLELAGVNSLFIACTIFLILANCFFNIIRQSIFGFIPSKNRK